jgi:hypothetical protein
MNFEFEELFRTREQLLNEIVSLDYDQFNRIIEINKWSIAQVCHHLLITETLFTKAIMFGLSQMNIIETKRKPIQLVSDRSKKFIAPKISEPSMEPFQVQQIIQLFSDSRNNLFGVLSKIDVSVKLSTPSTTNLAMRS